PTGPRFRPAARARAGRGGTVGRGTAWSEGSSGQRRRGKGWAGLPGRVRRLAERRLTQATTAGPDGRPGQVRRLAGSGFRRVARCVRLSGGSDDVYPRVVTLERPPTLAPITQSSEGGVLRGEECARSPFRCRLPGSGLSLARLSGGSPPI